MGGEKWFQKLGKTAQHMYMLGVRIIYRLSSIRHIFFTISFCVATIRGQLYFFRKPADANDSSIHTSDTVTTDRHCQ